MNRALPCYADAETLRVIGERFAYVFEPIDPNSEVVYKPTLLPHTISQGDRITIGELTADVFVQDHGYCETLGFRFGDIAYSTDVVNLTDAAFDIVAGVDTWIIGTLVDQPHPTHADVDKALGWMERAGVKRGFLTHISPFMDHRALCARLPNHVRPAFDGLVVED